MATSCSLNTEFQSSRFPEIQPINPHAYSESEARGLFSGLEREVPRESGRPRAYVNLDNAATTPPFREVLTAIEECGEWYASVHRSVGFKSRLCTDLYDHCHKEIARLLDADLNSHTVIFTGNTTQAINMVSHHLRLAPGERILKYVMEHHSNMLPWRQAGPVEYAGIQGADGALDLEDLERKLQRNRGRIRLVAVTGASNVTGAMPPIRRIARLAHEHGAELLVDAAQWVAHQPIAMGTDGDSERIDFLCFSAHKTYAPFGSGVLIGPRPFFEQGPAETVGGGTIARVSLTDVVWAGLPNKAEPGSPNVIGAWALVRAMKILERLGLKTIARHEQALTARLLRRLAGIPGVRVFGDADPERVEGRIGVVPIQVDRFPHALLASILSHEYAIGVRHGCFCAQPYVAALLNLDEAAIATDMQQARAGIVGEHPGLVRISLGLYNTAAEIDYFSDALEEIVLHGPHGHYHLDAATGEYMAENSSYNLADYIFLP